jgi:hypothetical protein
LNAGNRAQQRRFAGAVCADESDDFAGMNLHRDAMQRFNPAKATFELLN